MTLAQLVVQLGMDVSALIDGASAAEKRLEQTGTRLYFLGSRIASGFSLPLAGAVGLIAKLGMDFDQAMTESLAIMDRVTPEMRKRMEAQAKVVSETTKFSATEAAKAYYALASAGLSAAQATEALPVVARFAQAGVMDLAHASESLAGVQASLGLKTDDARQNMVNMTRVTDVLVEVNNKALGNVRDFTTALERAGGSLRLYSKSVEEGGAVLGVYAEQGILGARAGTQLYMVLRDLSNAAVKQPEHFKQAGIAVFDASGKMRNMADIVDDITKRFGPLSDAARRQELAFLGLTSRSQQALFPLIGMGDRIRELQKDLESAGGITQKVSDNQMLSLENQLKALGHQFQNVAIDVFQGFLPVIREKLIPLAREVLTHIRDWGMWLANLSDRQKEWIAGLVAAGIALGPATMLLGSLLLTIRALSSPLVMLASGLRSVVSAGSALMGAGGLVALLSNPWVLGGAVVIAGLAAAFYALHNAQIRAKESSHNYLDQSVTTLDNVQKKMKEMGIGPGTGGFGGLNIPIAIDRGGPRSIGPGAPPPGGGGGGGGEQGAGIADTSPAKRLQSLMDRLLGKPSLEEAVVWAQAIDKIGGVAKLREDDAKQAFEVFDRALRAMNGWSSANSVMMSRYTQIYNDLAQTPGVVAPLHATPIRDIDGKPIPPYMDTMPGTLPSRNPFSTVKVPGNNHVGFNPSQRLAASELDYDKKFDVRFKATIAGLSTLSTEFAKLAQITEGAFSSAAKGIGEFLTKITMAGKSSINLKTAVGEIGHGDVMNGIMNLASGAMGIAGAFMAATNNASSFKNVMGGAATGASAGAAFGPIGAAVGAGIGALAAVIKGKPEWAKLKSDIGRDLGVGITDEMAKAMEADSKKFGRQATLSLHLKDLVEAAGGLNSGNLDKFSGKLRDTFVMIETHQLTTAQGAQILDDNFANFAEHATDEYGFLGDKMKEIIELNDRFGTQSKAIADYLAGQGRVAIESFTTQVAGSTMASADNLKNLATQAITAYAAAVASGMSEAEALKIIAPAVDSLMKKYEELGIEVDNVALKNLAFQAKMVTDNPKVLDGIVALTKGMVALENMGVMNTDTFTAMQKSGQSMAEDLYNKSVHMGGGWREALMPMQGYLHTVVEEAKKLGVPIDDSTQSLIDMSKDLGIWKEKGKDATDVLIGKVGDLVDKMDLLIKRLSNIPDADFNIRGHYVPPPEAPPGTEPPDLPPLAAGGLVTRPTAALIGEAGPEAVIPLAQLRRMMSGSGQSMVVVLEVDGREMARKTVEYMPSVLRQHGLFQ